MANAPEGQEPRVSEQMCKVAASRDRNVSRLISTRDLARQAVNPDTHCNELPSTGEDGADADFGDEDDDEEHTDTAEVGGFDPAAFL